MTLVSEYLAPPRRSSCPGPRSNCAIGFSGMRHEPRTPVAAAAVALIAGLVVAVAAPGCARGTLQRRYHPGHREPAPLVGKASAHSPGAGDRSAVPRRGRTPY